jgi:hypothetical protein
VRAGRGLTTRARLPRRPWLSRWAEQSAKYRWNEEGGRPRCVNT